MFQRGRGKAYHEVDMYAYTSFWELQGHGAQDERPPVASLSNVGVVPKSLHQFVIYGGDARYSETRSLQQFHDEHFFISRMDEITRGEEENVKPGMLGATTWNA